MVKKGILILMVFCVVGMVTAHANPYVHRGESRTLFNETDPIIVHRNAVITADVAYPAIGSGEDLQRWNKALVHVDTSDFGWDITPLYGDISVSGKYFAGETARVSGDTIYSIDVNGCRDFYILIDNEEAGDKVGGNPVTVYLTPTS